MGEAQRQAACNKEERSVKETVIVIADRPKLFINFDLPTRISH
jgi:hypothetical protein